MQARGRRDFFVETVGGHHYRCLHTPCIECRRARGRYDPTAARYGEMVTLIGGEIGIDDVAAAIRSIGREVLSHLGSRFHCICYAI